jgi:hypothetical protein
VEDCGPPLSILQRVKSLQLPMVTAEVLYHSLIECTLTPLTGRLQSQEKECGEEKRERKKRERKKRNI